MTELDIPVDCLVVHDMSDDGMAVQAFLEVIETGGYRDDMITKIEEAGFDSVDKVDYTMGAVDCKSCEADGRGCSVGTFLLETFPELAH